MENKLAGKDNALPQRVEKPWGFEILFAVTSGYAGKVLFVKKGRRLSFHYHQIKDEVLYVHEGKVNLEIERDSGSKKSLTLCAGECVRIYPFTRHRIAATEDTTLFEVSTPDLYDVVRLEDDYGRTDR